MLNLFSRPLITLLVLFGTAACGGELAGVGGNSQENIEVATETSGLGAGCTLLYPIVWNGPNWCREYNVSRPYEMADGEFYSNYGYGWPQDGYGEVAVSCHNGAFVLEYSYCNFGPVP